ncbi:hypothetical protein CANCADRAFT_1281 [Tortispora caseinolytica NRRL Y-17796]|uniref:peptidyl-tRNA hydrolase n=1 Tax=Tortispora caseinolytica NRRL Y-17796 TaxID=767744 RepID=A0A1E4TLP2_9ASCO|nr:hypothetical protein CANCADRAFT_1281 [Tortispora caseinolytica NRRL Y-17796]
MSSIKYGFYGIGNPGKLALTRHSAGNIVLEMVRAAYNLPAFQSVTNGQISVGTGILLFQSGVFMNESGRAVVPEIRRHRDTPFAVVHDDLELKLGAVKVQHQGSLKGHNGLRSIAKALGGDAFSRIRIGIGRPSSRDPETVQGYVLSRFTRDEQRVLEEETLPQLLEHIESMISTLT